MRRLILALVLPILLVTSLTGCSSVSTRAPRPATGLAHDPSHPFFVADATTVDDLELARMLDTDLPVPPRMRIGVVHLTHRRERGDKVRVYKRSDELPRVHGAFEGLLESRRVLDVSYLPRMLMPQLRSSGNLRASAARYQIDWLLLFDTRTVIFRKRPIFAENASQVWCEAECAVLDVRTGLIAFSSQSRTAVQSEDPNAVWDGEQAVAMVEEMAIAEAMRINAGNLKRFLDALDAPVVGVRTADTTPEDQLRLIR